ncbi:MAG: hypothetical protein R3Y32_03615 [Bacillota bacterium]
MNKNNRNFLWLVLCLICVVAFVALGICSGVSLASAQEYEDATVEDLTAVETIVSSISGSTDDISAQIELWQEYIDKYIMPNALAVVTGVSMVFAVFSKFKYLVNLYKENKEEFDSEKETIFAELKSEVSTIMQTLSDVKQSTSDTIESMPISQIQEDLSKAKEALETEVSSIQDFTRMFEIFLASERKLVDTSYLSAQDKKTMKKLFYEGEQLAKKNQASLSDVSDFVLATIGSTTEETSQAESESVATDGSENTQTAVVSA